MTNNLNKNDIIYGEQDTYTYMYKNDNTWVSHNYASSKLIEQGTDIVYSEHDGAYKHKNDNTWFKHNYYNGSGQNSKKRPMVLFALNAYELKNNNVFKGRFVIINNNILYSGSYTNTSGIVMPQSSNEKPSTNTDYIIYIDNNILKDSIRYFINLNIKLKRIFSSHDELLNFINDDISKTFKAVGLDSSNFFKNVNIW